MFPPGGHASDTKRATNLKSFVRKDQGKAVVRIHLYNGGELAYDPVKWGNEIIFEKQINENGNNPFYVRGKKMLLDITLRCPINVRCKFINFRDFSHQYFLIIDRTFIDFDLIVP